MLVDHNTRASLWTFWIGSGAHPHFSEKLESNTSYYLYCCIMQTSNSGPFTVLEATSVFSLSLCSRSRKQQNTQGIDNCRKQKWEGTNKTNRKHGQPDLRSITGHMMKESKEISEALWTFTHHPERGKCWEIPKVFCFLNVTVFFCCPSENSQVGCVSYGDSRLFVPVWKEYHYKLQGA